MRRFSLITSICFMFGAACGGEVPGEWETNGDILYAEEFDYEAELAALRAPDEPEGFEPDEEAADLVELVGLEAVETFMQHQEARKSGIDPEELDGVIKKEGGFVTSAAGVVTRRTIYGWVRDSSGRPVAGVRVTAFDADPGRDDLMGRVYTDGNGYYEIHYRGGHWDPCPHRWTCWRPDIYVTVSARKWKVSGDRYDGKPLCNNVTYGWRRETTSRKWNNWRLRRSRRVDLRSRPRSQIWDERGDKPDCLRGPFCYNFSYIVSSCYGFVETLTGCSGGYEYSWRDGCFGYFTGAVHDGRRQCFSTPIERGNVCEGAEAGGAASGPNDRYDAPCEENPWGGCG